MNRGSRRDPGETGATARAFNEAPIHESGKWHSRETNGNMPRAFNEAPIHESGKC